MLINLALGDGLESPSRDVAGFVKIPVGMPSAACALTLPDGSADGIVIPEHFERLTPMAAVSLLRECRRVLRPGGHIRIAIADVTNRRRDPLRSWRRDEAELARFATLAGLTLVERFVPNESRLECFRDLEGPACPELIVELQKVAYTTSSDPLVSILVPAYKTPHLRECLESALAQTWSNTEIIVSDDSEGDEVARIIASLGSTKIRYQKNPHRLGGAGNYRALLRYAQGAYLKFLSDDDLLHPNSVERMARCLQANPDVTLVTSHRHVIDADGQRLHPTAPEWRPVASDSWVDGLSATNLMLSARQNFIGEPSTVLFRRADIEEIPPRGLFCFDSMLSHGNGDVTTWMSLLSRGHLIYLVEALSSFRVHAAQQQLDPQVHAAAVRAWDFDRESAMRFGLYDLGRPPILISRPLADRPWWPEPLRQSFQRLDSVTQAGDLQAARSQLEVACTLDDGRDPTVALRIAKWHLAHGEAKAALGVLDGVVAEHPEQVSGLILQARALARLGDDQRALEACAAAAMRAPLVSCGAGISAAGSEYGLDAEASLYISAVALPLNLGFELVPPPHSALVLPIHVRVTLGDEEAVDVVFSSPGQVEHLAFTLPASATDLEVRLNCRGSEPAPSTGTASPMLVLRQLRFWPATPGESAAESTAPRDTPSSARVQWLCIPDPQEETWLHMVVAYLETCAGLNAPVSLLVRVEPPTEASVEHLYAKLGDVIDRLGMSPDACPDILVLADPLPANQRAEIYHAATAFIRCPGRHAGRYCEEARAAGLPILDGPGSLGWEAAFRARLSRAVEESR